MMRRRIEEAQMGSHDNYVIWAIGTADVDMLNLGLAAFEVLEQWLDDQQKPATAGEDVWDGMVTGDPIKGPCALKYPVYADPRMVAGEDISTDIFKCATDLGRPEDL